MSIKEQLRKALLKEGKHSTNEYGCVMLYLKYDKAEWSEMQKTIKDEDLYNPKDNVGYGREDKPHVSILYGLPSDIEDEKVEVKINEIKKPTIKLGKVSFFENDKFDVLKFEVLGDDIHKLNTDFKELPYTNSFPKYEPHCTIAYVKKGLAKEYVDKLNDLSTLKISPDKIVYSKADGKKIDYQIK